MMVRWFGSAVLIASLSLLPSSLAADDLGSSDLLLCTAAVATLCLDDGECESGPPWLWNIPQFIEVDLEKKELRSTKASGQNRSTPIKHLVRNNGLIVLQGFEMGRAFSFVITEESGDASFAVAREGITVGAFGACTPMAGRG